jgi:SNF2 family DNA or RNA helicase
MDLWSQLYLVDAGHRLEKNISKFRDKYFRQNPYVLNKWDLLGGAEAMIKEKISDVCISMNQKDYLELPDMIYSDVIVPMDNTTKKIYDDFSKDFIMTYNGVDITANQKATLQNKLLQICNGAIYDNDKNTIVLNNDKVQALRDMIDDNHNENFLVAYTYKSDLERLQKEFKGICKVLDTSSDTIKHWNDRKIKMLLAHPASAGHGLNLQHGGNTIVWFGLTWSLELYQQFNKRLHRLGQKSTVKIVHLISDTAEEMHVAKALQYKAKNQQEFLDYIQANTMIKFNTT